MASTTTTVPGASPFAGSRSFLDKLRDGDEIARLITFLFAASVVLITVLLVAVLWQESALARHKFGLHFLWTRVWDPIMDDFGALPFIYGTVITSAVALFVAVPLGIGAAIFLAELAPARALRYLGIFHRPSRCRAQCHLRLARLPRHGSADARHTSNLRSRKRCLPFSLVLRTALAFLLPASSWRLW